LELLRVLSTTKTEGRLLTITANNTGNNRTLRTCKANENTIPCLTHVINLVALISVPNLLRKRFATLQEHLLVKERLSIIRDWLNQEIAQKIVVNTSSISIDNSTAEYIWLMYNRLFDFLNTITQDLEEDIKHDKIATWPAVIRNTAIKGKAKLSKYYRVTSGERGFLFNYATILDPTQKLTAYKHTTITLLTNSLLPRRSQGTSGFESSSTSQLMKENQTTYPRLTIVARDILVIPIAGVYRNIDKEETSSIARTSLEEDQILYEEVNNLFKLPA
ncbi:hypothetical protein BKA66DRAFT_480079, partial [Pyrenochaeta sp. MPI-SDFR-AT-0127]